jgi:hypothetical protein
MVDGLCSDAGSIQVFEPMQWCKQTATLGYDVVIHHASERQAAGDEHKCHFPEPLSWTIGHICKLTLSPGH